MFKERPRELLASFVLIACAIAAVADAQEPLPATNGAVNSAAAGDRATIAETIPAASNGEGVRIVGLAESPTERPIGGTESHIGLNSKLWVVLSRVPPGEIGKYVLFLNDEEIQGLDAPIATTYQSQPALLFKLKRSAANDPFWRELLGAPRARHIPVTVSLGEQAGADLGHRISGAAGDSSFAFQVFTGVDLAIAAGVILLVLILLWGSARYRTTLRDNLLPQLAPSRQPYSLGRSQMAFWFTLIFAAFVVLFFLLQDTNTLTSQALLLMGISGATALAAISVDVAKNSPADDANRGLQALGLQTYEDVQRVRQEIIDRQQRLAGSTLTEQVRSQLQIEINDRNSVLRTYDDKTLPFISQGWFKDVTTDINGPTVHRLQVVFWTGTLGAIFLYSVYRNLAMPEFNGTLLTLMGISGAGYVGFKIKEINN